MNWSDAVLHYFDRPARIGRLPAGKDVVTAAVRTPAARDRVDVSMRVAGGRIADIRYHALGSPATLAAMAWLAESLQGQAVEALTDVCSQKIQEVLALPMERMYAALLVEDAAKVLARAAVPES
jgi:NifU-like protein involved in Fe-S cluster formation